MAYALENVLESGLIKKCIEAYFYQKSDTKQTMVRLPSMGGNFCIRFLVKIPSYE